MTNPVGHWRILWLLPFVAAGGACSQKKSTSPQLTSLPHPELPAPVDVTQAASSWLMILICMGAAILLGIVIWLLFRKQSHKIIPEVPPLTLAHRRLLELLDESEILEPAETGHRVSVIMREYQMGRYAVPAPFRTREELYELRQFSADEERRDRFATVAQTCDQFAFAPAPATKEEAQSLIHAAIETLRGEVVHAEGAVLAAEHQK